MRPILFVFLFFLFFLLLVILVTTGLGYLLQWILPISLDSGIIIGAMVSYIASKSSLRLLKTINNQNIDDDDDDEKFFIQNMERFSNSSNRKKRKR